MKKKILNRVHELHEKSNKTRLSRDEAYLVDLADQYWDLERTVEMLEANMEEVDKFKMLAAAFRAVL